MANRKRNIQMKFYVTEEEKRLIDEKMAQLPTRRYGAYLRKMAIDGYNAAHFRPQVAFIRKAPPLSCGGEGLTGEAAGNDGDCFKSCFLKKRLLRECGDVPELRHIRPVPLQDRIGVVRPFTLANGLESGCLRRQVQTADAGEQAYMGQSLHTSSPSRPSSWGSSSTSSRGIRLWRLMMASSRTSWAALLSSGRPRLRKSFFSTFS